MWPSTLQMRWRVWREDILRPLRVLYGDRDDFEKWVTHFLKIVTKGFQQRSAELRELDQQRLLQPDWYQQSDQIGYIAYVDRFAETLHGVQKKIPYLQELGVTYLHLMPLLQPRKGENDGGYAVVDYKSVDERLGTMEDLAELSAELRNAGISLCTDLVCNHTAIEHKWAIKARTGDAQYQAYYWMFDDRTVPDQYEKNLREIFPEFKEGNFLYHEEMKKWVWTTFHPYQWDLNYHNPAVFGEMLEIMLYLANQGVEVLRMDAVAFMWKEMGTSCENLPQTHALLQAWRALTKLVAPALLLKAEAIVSPDLVVPYFGTGEGTNKECELAYHNSLMVLLWSALAERKVDLLTHSLQNLPKLPTNGAWATYVRCHDDIGWAITDENAAGVGINAYAHRSFLSDFYSGVFPNSFARGTVFQFNSNNLDRRINGSCASLAGLEWALDQKDSTAMQLAIGRILLIHSIILAYGGIPLLYMGDELGMLNDYNYTQNPEKAADSRWIHRPKIDWDSAESRHTHSLYTGLRHLIQLRKSLHALHAQAETLAVPTGNQHIFALIRQSSRGKILVLGNFHELTEFVSAEHLREFGLGETVYDYISGYTYATNSGLYLRPFQSMWLEKRG